MSGWTVRLATYNLLHGLSLHSGRVDLPAVAELIARLGADLVAVQEVDRCQERSGGTDQVAVLAERLGMEAVFAPALLGSPERLGQAARGYLRAAEAARHHPA
jgi:endonuclease/exonuclease/phosphatase family metal-dependent hydrolase